LIGLHRYIDRSETWPMEMEHEAKLDGNELGGQFSQRS